MVYGLEEAMVEFDDYFEVVTSGKGDVKDLSFQRLTAEPAI